MLRYTSSAQTSSVKCVMRKRTEPNGMEGGRDADRFVRRNPFVSESAMTKQKDTAFLQQWCEITLWSEITLNHSDKDSSATDPGSVSQGRD